MASNANPFFWYELMTTDLDAARAFYGDVVGWKTAPFGPAQDNPYLVLSANGQEVAGMMARPQDVDMPPAWMGYIHTPDVDAAAAGIEKAGGHVYRAPSDIPEVGRFAVVADPHGAVFMIMAPKGEGGPGDAPRAPGHIGWRELYAGDMESAFSFYADQFGWEKDAPMDMGEMGVYQLVRTGGAEPSAGMMTKTSDMPSPFWLFYFNVDDIDAAAGRVKDKGGSVMMGPQEVPGGSWILQCMDPQGAMFALAGPRH